MDAKQRAGESALQYVRDGMVIGLGTGSTARFFIQAVGSALRNGGLRDVRGVPTSVNSERLARESGLPVITFSQIKKIDITVDGADEVTPQLMLIKGLGGALLREKLVAQNSDRVIIIVDQSKIVDTLGTRSPLPVEVTPFGQEANARFLADLGCTPILRRHPDGAIFLTDNQNYILDCKFNAIADPRGLDRKLADRAGIVESGLFLDLADIAIIADENSVRTISQP
jgi:ribose 5-phosphate isomerase A